MKLYLCVNQQPLNGYRNFDLAHERLDFQNPNSICDPACCTEIIIDGVLSYLNLQAVPQFLQLIISRMRRNGRLIINDYDSNEVMQKFLNGILSIADLNLVMFGNGQPSKASCLSHKDLHDILQGNGLTISSIDLTDLNFSIVAQRI